MNTEDDEFEARFAALPEVICSQLHVGQTLTESDVKAIQEVLSKLDSQENNATEAFHEGRLAGFREIGGEELVTSVQLKDAEQTATHVRRIMDKLFPKSQRRPQ